MTNRATNIQNKWSNQVKKKKKEVEGVFSNWISKGGSWVKLILLADSGQILKHCC